MEGDWRETTIGEIAAPVRNALVGGPFGSNLVSRDYVDAGVPVIRGQNMGGRWVSGEFAFVTNTKAASLNANIARPGDIVFTQRGTVGQVSVVPTGKFDRYLVSQSQMKLTVNRDLVEPLFIYYVFSTSEQQNYIRQNAIQTGVPHTNLGILRSTPVPLPPLREQRNIAHILGTLDDKIELNRRMNETLEAMARALFKSWFVDFDPVRSKAEGRDSGLPKPLVDLFPARLVDSELGEIPEGWDVARFADTIDIVGGGTPKTAVAEYWDGDIPWFSVVDAPTGSEVWVVDTEKKVTRAGVESSSTRVLPVGTTIISARGTVGRIALVGVPMAMNQSCYGLRGRSGGHGFYNYFSTRELVARLQQHAHGSVFDTITRDTLAGVSVVTTPAELIDEFEKQVGPSLERIRAAFLETCTLAALSETLLPKLISGELRVKGAEKYIGRAV
jgi:type I restriction enzyme, S subunit